MPPSPHRNTPPSIHSYWSDSNSGLQGPTINLHTVAKPLLKRMYHRQALQLIKKNRESPLSKEKLAIYSSYFPWNYVSSSTKDAIFGELIARSAFEVDARAIIDSPFVDYMKQMLGSSDTGAQILACQLAGNLVSHECNKPLIWEFQLCAQLVSLFEYPEVIPEATRALCQIARWPDGAHAIMDANAEDHIIEFLHSQSPKVREWACNLMGRLASHESTAPTILELEPYMQLVTLSGEENSRVAEAAMYGLSQIACWLEGAQAIMDVMELNRVLAFLESPYPSLREYTCWLLSRIVSHGPTAPAILDLNPCMWLAACLRDEDSLVIEAAMHALSKIACWLDGAKAIVDSKAETRILVFLQSARPGLREYTCSLLGCIAGHNSTAPAVLELKPCMWLVACLRDEDSRVIDAAMYALSRMSFWLDGAQAVVDAKAMDHILRLLESSSSDIRRHTCRLVRSLASHEFTAPAILELNPWVQLGKLLRDKDFRVIVMTERTLVQIAHWSDGAKSIVNAKILAHVLVLLESPNPDIRKWACTLVGKIASHASTSPDILKLKRYIQVVNCLRGKESETIAASYALVEIARMSEGARAIVNANALEHGLRFLESSSTNLRGWTCVLIGRIASHNSTAAAVLKLAPYRQLMSFLGAENSWSATYALSQIARRSDGTQAIIGAQIMDRILELLESPHSGTRFWAFTLVGILSSHKSVASTFSSHIFEVMWEKGLSSDSGAQVRIYTILDNVLG